MVVQSRNLIVAVSLSAAVRLTTGSTDTLQVTGDAITEINCGSVSDSRQHVLDSSMTACMHTVMQSRDLFAAAFLWAALRVRRDQHEDNIGSSKHYARPRFDDRL